MPFCMFDFKIHAKKDINTEEIYFERKHFSKKNAQNRQKCKKGRGVTVVVFTIKTDLSKKTLF